MYRIKFERDLKELEQFGYEKGKRTKTEDEK